MGTSRSNTTGGGRGALNRSCRMPQSPNVDCLVDLTAVLDQFAGTGVSIPSGLSTENFPSAHWRQADMTDAPVTQEWFLPSLNSTAS